MRDNKRGTIEDRAYEASVLGVAHGTTESLVTGQLVPDIEPQSPHEARLDAAIDKALDFAAYRVLDLLLDRLAPLVVSQSITPEQILGVLTILRDEYKEHYEAHRAA